MRFGFDIDDTLINLREHAFHIYNKKLKKNVPIDIFHTIKTLEIHEPFGLSTKEGNQLWLDSMEEIYFTDCPPYPEAVEVLQELHDQGHEIYYITARPAKHCKQTKKWVEEAGFPVQEGRFFCGMKDEEKIHTIKDLNLDYYFDDKPNVLNTLTDQSVQLYVRDQSYNQHMDIPRLTNWSELKEIIKKHTNKN
ncbi:HAD hydrolase-like protein [Fictibacillus nanhaiensis]|uniref:5' nucleotidase, NT5C type n=1 Tax=Fictibacillus nanhaiensis TaxID=742169 RepID=UPI00203FDE3E|nr:HAD hydrolase-like protein [Fictibacillus nanhaiensis]MCM3732802.1 HAD hydrolase-like protein [Fictibacillus nanhaiensis]